MFDMEYRIWFKLFLPGLHLLQSPIPLGGTSNHFRKDVLEKLGGWDAYNVTEDADLGIRMFLDGYIKSVYLILIPLKNARQHLAAG